MKTKNSIVSPRTTTFITSDQEFSFAKFCINIGRTWLIIYLLCKAQRIDLPSSLLFIFILISNLRLILNQYDFLRKKTKITNSDQPTVSRAHAWKLEIIIAYPRTSFKFTDRQHAKMNASNQ